jgi:N-acetylmuramoyl-L-alanine amidase
MFKKSEKDIAILLAMDVHSKANSNLRNIKKLYLHKDLKPDNLNDELSDLNNNKIDFGLHLHFNAFDGTGKANGFETFKYEKETNKNILSLINNVQCFMTQTLKFQDRGVKNSPGFCVIDNTNDNVKSVLWEFGFMDSQKDMQLFAKNYKQIVNQWAYAITYYLYGNVMIVYSDQTCGGTNYL